MWLSYFKKIIQKCSYILQKKKVKKNPKFSFSHVVGPASDVDVAYNYWEWNPLFLSIGNVKCKTGFTSSVSVSNSATCPLDYNQLNPLLTPLTLLRLDLFPFSSSSSCKAQLLSFLISLTVHEKIKPWQLLDSSSSGRRERERKWISEHHRVPMSQAQIWVPCSPCLLSFSLSPELCSCQLAMEL